MTDREKLVEILTEHLGVMVCQWISVKDRLPDEEVLAANFAPGTHGYKEYIIGYVEAVRYYDPDWEKDKYVAENDFQILENVTHWMPLPEPPKKEENSNESNS